MNKSPKMDFKGQTAVLSAFVLVGMMFLVPAVIERALARIEATATGTCGPEGQTHPCEFTLLGKNLYKGVWVQEPSESGTSVKWVTGGNIGDEEGLVLYKVEGGRAELWFKNPLVGVGSISHLVGSNECKIYSSTVESSSSCTAGQGMDAKFTYNLRVR